MNVSEFLKNEKKVLFFIVLTAIGIRLFFMFWLTSYRIDSHWDWDFAYEMGSIAKSLAMGEGFASPFGHPGGPTAIVPPLYPYFLAMIFKIFGVCSTESAIVILSIHCLVSAFTCIPLYYVAKTLFGRYTGYLAATGLAFHPTSVWYAVNTIWDTTFFTFLGILLMSLAFLLPQKFTYKTSAAFGAFVGFIALLKSVVLAFYPFLLLFFFLQSPLPRKRTISRILVICSLTGVVLMPWILRNYLVFGRVMLRSNFGLELKLENCSETWTALEKTGDSNVFSLQHPTINSDELLLYQQVGELKYMDICLEKAKTFIRKHPEKYMILTLKRISYLWIGDFDRKNNWMGNLDAPFSISGLKKLFLLLPLPFAFIGILLAIQRHIPHICLTLMYILVLPGVYYITHVCSRFRYPVEPLILMFAVYGLSALIPQNRMSQIGLSDQC
ncbi:MAG: hypothetical protein B6245_04820 [Desulfobacteraceae bacterium 4572_88]|nr:MAG: hypothetical protein B6245_04820 [Desulfobacteraceae bacterium 4572_88]RLC21733.1 MAG: hypothetical protein DRI57_01635 [Deltaproteobacteria bacterium]